MEQDTRTSRIILYQDLGLLLFLLAVLAGALITGLSDKALLYQHVVLMMAIMLSAMITGLRTRVGGIIISGITILLFAIYKLFYRFAYYVQK